MTLHIKPQHKTPANPKPDVGKRYRITGYHCGNFVGTCVAALFTQARYRVENPLGSTLHKGDEIDIRYGLAKFEHPDDFPSEPEPAVVPQPFPSSEEEANLKGYSFAYRTTCLGCGEPIRFWRTPRGKFIPMNGTAFVPHWSTCALPSRFRRPR